MKIETVTKIIRNGRYLRAGIGVALLGLGAAVYLPHALYTISDQAVINARTVSLITPIEGVVARRLPEDGTFVATGDVLTVIENRAVDRSREQHLQSELHGLEQRLAALVDTDAELAQLSTALSGDLKAFRKASVARLETMVREAGADADSARAAAREASREAGRKRQLVAGGVVSVAAAEASEDRAARAAAEAERATLHVQRLSQELEAARKGMYLLEARNDVPYTRQRIDELAVRRIDIAAQRRELTARREATELALQAERNRLSLMARTEVVAPIDGIVWRPQISAGTWVAPSSPLVTLIDCRTRFVSVRLPGRSFERLQPGTGATIRVLGADRTESAVVQDVRGMGAKEQQDRLAAPIPELNQGELIAILTLHSNATATEGRAFCDVGRRVEVTLDGGAERPGWLARLTGLVSPSKADVLQARHDKSVSELRLRAAAPSQ